MVENIVSLRRYYTINIFKKKNETSTQQRRVMHTDFSFSRMVSIGDVKVMKNTSIYKVFRSCGIKHVGKDKKIRFLR